MVHSDESAASGPAMETEGAQIWDAIPNLTVAWANAQRRGDPEEIRRAERELRFFSLMYGSLTRDDPAVTTGRKAILRALYAESADEARNVAPMLDTVIRREEREQASS